MNIHALDSALSIVPPSLSDMKAAADQFEQFAPVQFSHPGVVNRLTQEGVLTAEQINFHGVPGFVMWWGKTMDGGLAINACQSLNMGVPIDVAFAAADAIRAREGCKHIRFASVRKGLIRAAASHGYTFETIVMRKG